METAIGAYVHQPGEAERRFMGETAAYFLASGDQTGGTFTLVDERANRGTSGPLHLHRDDMESFYVLEGEITFHFGGSQAFGPVPVRSRTYQAGPFTAFESSRKRPAT